jgi:glyoxylase-like metal-dependent hydrolase (beta-lactamase superfamily II)
MINAHINVGNIQLTTVSGGRLRIDGGNMFGVIPRAMWERKAPPDEHNRILLETNCVLVRTANTLGLVDTGYGGKSPMKYRQRHALEDGMPLVRNLAAVGVAPNEIDWVVLTHLHADHAGGATLRNDDERPKPVFARARHFVQQSEWIDAMSGLPELAGAYYPVDFAPLEQAGLLELIDGDVEIVPGISTQLTGGHTRGHQIVRIESAGDSAVCLADICPTAAHLPIFWTMAYDQYPLEVRRKKPVILRDIGEHQRIALFSHDPQIAGARLSRDSDEWIIVQPAASCVAASRES